MQLKRVEIIKYRNFENIVIDFEKSDFPNANVFSIASKNGGGKSTLLQFIFIMLHCIGDKNRHSFFEKIVDEDVFFTYSELVKFIIEKDKKEYYLNIDFDRSCNFNFQYDTNMSKDFLEELSNSIYLTVPEAQVLHFLSEEEDMTELHRLLPNFSTYNFPTEKDILKSFDNAKEKDFEEMRLNGKYGTHYIELKDNLKDFIEGKEIVESKDATKIAFKINKNHEELLLENLSHGEMRKLGIYIWLKNIVKKESIILMDEPDIALHPKWQYELITDLTTWSKDSQFLLATHSPQILSSTYYKNIIKLDSEGVKRFNKPPVDRDINTIITQIMEADDFPIELLLLHKKYRKLINDGKVETEEAKELKEEILEYESENSSFFQEINFDLELM